MENREKNKFDISTVCTFASPRVGNAEFVNQFNQLPLTLGALSTPGALFPHCSQGSVAPSVL